MKYLPILIYWIPFLSLAQIEGYIEDEMTKKPLMGASIYYEGTSIGVVSNQNGYFLLETPTGLESPIIVSYVGYISKQFTKAQLLQTKKISLQESTVKLKGITLLPDDWSREKKWRYFKKEFLGTSPAASSCKITNPEDVILVFDKETSTLNAYANKPILVQNNYLGYQIRYELHKFYIHMRLKQLNPVHKVHLSGRSFFTDIGKNKPKKFAKRRKKMYRGSLLHFLRSTKAAELTKNGYHLYHNKFRRDPKEYIKVKQLGDISRVDVREHKLTILYKKRRSGLIFPKANKHFFIDAFGNQFPIEAFLVSGDFGKQRIANILPLDYGISN
ncbi:MAG: carboxypeptidase-like regulatory domain-containing protein [Flavobacteriaceae bacterium]|nr:carboxypeptidase-like regulatory domain-containing protein [Flavobacteriaceae bacterium]